MTSIVDKKKCTKCKEIKSVDNFSKNRTAKDGLFSWCRQCNSSYKKEANAKITKKCLYCDNKTTSSKSSMCKTHSERLRLKGDLGLDIPVKKKRARGEGHINVYGYKIVFRKGHPNAHGNGKIAEHTLVMSEMLGRPLLPGENVHHKNGNRLDNRPENLELWSKVQPAGQRVEDKVIWAIDLLRLYKPEALAECSQEN